MTLKSDSKFKEKMTWSFKHDMGNLASFHQTTQKSENFTSMDYYFCSEYMGFELKNIEESSFTTLSSDPKLISKMA